MAKKRKAGRVVKPAHKTKSAAKSALKTTPRETAPAAKHTAKRKPARKAKSKTAMEKVEAAVVEIAKGIVPKARKAIRSVSRTISGKK
jgi:hypothetical protein